MKGVVAVCIGISLLVLPVWGAALAQGSHDSSQPGGAKSASAEKPKLETLLSAALEGVESTEVIVSRVTIPPNTSLPKHWHPGEEFAYILEGSATLWQDGKEDITAKAGDVMKISLKQVHTAITGDEGATILVFRVHEHGKPERILVD
jgi:quercetin dioxygenase-like cupin family protein